MKDLRSREGAAPRALEFLILTCARSAEVLQADWSEIDFQRRCWTIPAERTKSGRQHRVPLSQPAFDLLMSLPKDQRDGPIFRKTGNGQPFSNMAMPMLLRRMKIAKTVHGFRSTFRDWASEMTQFSNEVCEMALAHSIPGKTEAAYRRGDLFLKRVHLMDQWASYCGSK